MEVVAENRWSIEGVLARLTALEERLSDPPTWKTFEAALNRIEALEEFRKGFPDDNDPHIDHPDSPNCGTFQPIDDGWKAEKAERDRQARWHATRDAYVTGHLARGRAAGDDDLVFHWAKAFADRAHGPLEGKAEVTYPTHPRPPEPTPEMLASPEFEAVWQVIKNWEVDHGGGMRSGATGNDVRAILDALARVPMTQDEIDDVGALVKAAKAIDETALSQALTAHEWKALVMDLRAALKPFEVKP